MSEPHSPHEPGQRHQGLHIISLIFTAVGGLLLVIGSGLLVFGLYQLVAGAPAPTPAKWTPLGPPQSGGLSRMAVLSTALVMWGLGLLAGGLQSLATGALFRLAIQVEENTRTTARCLEKLSAAQEPRLQQPGPFFVS